MLTILTTDNAVSNGLFSCRFNYFKYFLILAVGWFVFGFSLTATATTPTALTVTLEQKNNSGGSWSEYSTSSAIINPGDEVNLKWDSTGATDCVSNLFSTSTATMIFRSPHRWLMLQPPTP